MSALVTGELLKGFLDAFNQHDLDSIMDYFAEDCVFYMPRGSAPRGDRYLGKGQVRDGLAKRFEGIPDVHYGEDQHWVCGNFGVSEWTLTGTLVSGKKIEVRGVDLLEFANGKIIRKDSSGKSLSDIAYQEEQMPQPQSTLDVIYASWQGYQQKLRDCIAPLTGEQLLLQPAPHMWPLCQIVQHIICVRAGWFSGTLQEDDEAMKAYMLWGQRDSPDRSAAELARALDETMAFIAARLQRWTPDDCARTFPDEEWEGQVVEVSRSWVIYHVMEHDLHHGGEISLILGINGFKNPNL